MFRKVEYVRLSKVRVCFPPLGDSCLTFVSLLYLKNREEKMFILYNVAKMSLEILEKIIRGILF